MATRKPPSRKTAETASPAEAAAEEAVEASAPGPDGTGGALPVKADGEAESSGHEPRFHFFIIDAGWKSAAAKVIRENFHMIREFVDDDPLYILSREQSVAVIRENPDLVGKDPIILVHDLNAKGGRGESGYHGFRLCLGLIKDGQQALAAMQKFLRFIHFHRNSPDIEKDIRERLHRKGLEGAIEIIREGAQEMTG